LLDAQGYDVRIINAGVNGDDIARIRKRLGTAVPKGTRIILLDPGFMNSKKRGVNVEDNMASIQQWVKARRVKLVVIRKLFYQAGSNLQADGQHFTPAGHALVAAKLAPQVRALLRK
jgi:acyl-CoA thioesterase I